MMHGTMNVGLMVLALVLALVLANGVSAGAGRTFNAQYLGYFVNSYGKERSFVTCFALL